MTVEHPFAYLRQRADVLKCCGQPRNLHVTEPRQDVKLAICKVCGRKHRKLFCEPGSILARTLVSGGAFAGKLTVKTFIAGAILMVLSATLLPSRALAQLVDWAECWSQTEGDKLVGVKVALMAGAIERFSSPVVPVESSVVALKPYANAVNVTALRIVCSFQVPGLPMDKPLVQQMTRPLATGIAMPANAPPKLAVTVIEVKPGVWWAFIGKAPP